MSGTTATYAVIRFLHDLLTVTWIGGILTMAVIFTPALRAAGPANGEARSALGSLTWLVRKRMAPIGVVCFVGLGVTGVLMARRTGAGFFRFDTPYAVVLSVKHLLILVLAGLMTARRSLDRRARRAAVLLLDAAALTGVAILALSAVNAALQTGA